MLRRSSLGLALLLTLSGSLHAQEATRQDAATKLLERGAQSRAKGPQGAPVLIYEIADFQCPFCARFAREVFPRIDSAYVKTGKVQWIYVNLPLPNHNNAWPAAEAALCAGAVADRFWNVHDRLYATQEEWAMSRDPGPALEKVARDAGVPMEAWLACVREDRVASLILQDVIFAARTQLTGTPAFIIDNDQMVVGIKSFEEWKELIDKAAKKTVPKD